MQQVNFSNKSTSFGYRNLYCDPIALLAWQFLPFDQVQLHRREHTWNRNLLETAYEYTILKNKEAGVAELFLKVQSDLVQPVFGWLKQYSLNGTCLLSELEKLPDIVSFGQCALLVENMDEKTESELDAYSLAAGEKGIPVMVQFGDSLEQMGRLDSMYNMSPARVLEHFGFLDRQCFLCGCNYLDKDDAMFLSNYQPTCVLTPRADMLLGKGNVNLELLLHAGLPIAFGSGGYPEIDLLKEGMLAIGETANLLNEKPTNLVDVLHSLQYGSKDFIRDERTAFSYVQNLLFGRKISEIGKIQRLTQLEQQRLIELENQLQQALKIDKQIDP